MPTPLQVGPHRLLHSPFGFAWGPALVTRMSSFTRKDHGKDRTSLCLGVETGVIRELPFGGDPAVEARTRKHSLHVYISQEGRSVRCFLDGQEMLTPDGWARKRARLSRRYDEAEASEFYEESYP
jgi:hypothetical protein